MSKEQIQKQTREERRNAALVEKAQLYAWQHYQKAVQKGRDIDTFLAGCRCADEHKLTPWRSMTTDGEPERSMFVLANLGFNYIVCEYKADVKEWWQCDGYIAGYSPEHKPLFSAKTKLTPKEVELIINYMEIPNEPNEDEDYE